jgi:hypothetical protein
VINKLKRTAVFATVRENVAFFSLNFQFLSNFYVYESLPYYGLQGSEFTGEEGPECAL